MVIAWFSSGVSSFISCYLLNKEIDHVVYIDIEDQHPDSIRFVIDCEKILKRNIEIITSPYRSVSNVIQQFRFINSPYGAKCTDILKKRTRKEYEKTLNTDLCYVWGLDCDEETRAIRIQNEQHQYDHIFPLIEKGISKKETHAIAEKLHIKRPLLYDLGYNNNNCVGCVKGGMGYWNKIRIDFPQIFRGRCLLERQIGRSCINGIFWMNYNLTGGIIKAK